MDTCLNEFFDVCFYIRLPILTAVGVHRCSIGSVNFLWTMGASCYHQILVGRLVRDPYPIVHLVQSIFIFRSGYTWFIRCLFILNVGYWCSCHTLAWCDYVSVQRCYHLFLFSCSSLLFWPMRRYIRKHIFPPSMLLIKNSDRNICIAHRRILDSTCLGELNLKANAANSYKRFLWSVNTCVCFASQKKYQVCQMFGQRCRQPLSRFHTCSVSPWMYPKECESLMPLWSQWLS